MKCPHCKAEMHHLDRGICPKCGKYCGCSKNPTTMGDYCRAHRPKVRAGTKVDKDDMIDFVRKIYKPKAKN